MREVADSFALSSGQRCTLYRIRLDMRSSESQNNGRDRGEGTPRSAARRCRAQSRPVFDGPSLQGGC
jgi:hypothetical protein